MASKQDITSKECIHLANDIIIETNLLIPRLTSLKDINYQLFCFIFNDIFRIDCSLFDPKTKSEEIDVISKLLSTLSNDLIGISLEHIKAEDIINKKLNTIYDLSEIISTFIKYIPKQINENVNNYHSIKRKFDTKSVQTNGENLLFSLNKQLKSDYCLNSNTIKNNKNQIYPVLKPWSGSSSSHTITSNGCECPDIIQSTSNSFHSNSCGDNSNCHPKQELITRSKAIQTDVETKRTPKTFPKTIEPKLITFDEYKRAKTNNFALELGHKLHETLKLKEMSEVIENKIKRYYGDVTAQMPNRTTYRSSTKARSGRKQLTRNKKSPIIRRKFDSFKVKNIKQNNQFSSLDDLLKTFPEIPRNTIKSLREQELHQNKIVERLNKDIVANEMKVKLKLNSVIETQNKRSQIIKKDLKHLESLAVTKNVKLEKLKDNAEKRDSRLERVRMHKTIESFHNDMLSKYKKLQSIEEKLVLKEFEKKHKSQQESIAQFRKRIKENNEMEIERQKKMLDAFETLYRNKYEMLTESLHKEEEHLKNEISQQSYNLRTIKRDYKKRFETDFRNLFDRKI